MAGGKQTPRQKMINLMYLVFIAMLALNMSKEVLSAFGSINEKLDRANISYVSKNNAALKALSDKAGENAKFKVASETAQAANDLTKAYNDYLALQKELLLSEFEDKTDYETMDQSAFLDALYYEGGEMTEAGQKFITQMDTYRNGMVALLGDTNPTLTNQINVDFSTADVKNRDGQTVNYLEKNYVTFPLVSSLTKMTQIQNDINTVENELLSTLLSGNLGDIASLTNYETVMTTSNGAYYTGSTFDGKLSLGRVDASTKPARVELLVDGKEIKANQFEYDGGRVVLKVGTGSVGDHKITGKLVYLQDGKEVEVLVDKKFTTINKPNAATISADKMNVLYRGVSNPMTITFAGIQDKDIRVNAPGLSRVNGSSYIMKPKKGTPEVTINVSGKLPDGGGTVSDKATFRVKPIPPPVGKLRGKLQPDGKCFRLPRASLENARVGAGMSEDFDFDLPLTVTGFIFKVDGQPEVKVVGTKLNDRAIKALSKAKRGATVRIEEISAVITSNAGYDLRRIAPMCIELAN
jgi:gliding motility-associated protein GldM